MALLVATATLGACGYLPSESVSPGPYAKDAAMSQIGVRYVYGASNPGSGFDCSGLTSWAWRVAGIEIPRTSAAQYAATERIGRDDLRPGDLVFYGYSGRVSHVTMYIGDGQIVHAPGAGRYVTTDWLDEYWTTALIGYGRVPGS